MNNIIKNMVVLAALMLLFMATSCDFLYEYYVVIDAKIKAVDHCSVDGGLLKYKLNDKVITIQDNEALCIKESK